MNPHFSTAREACIHWMALWVGENKVVRGAQLPVEPQQWRVFSYAEDFARLWTLAPQELTGAVAWPEETCTLVVLWDRLPAVEMVVDTGRYLTPLDWAVAFSLENTETSPPVRLVILDLGLTPDAGQADADASRFFRQFPAARVPALPWIGVYRSPVSAFPTHGLDELARLCQDASALPTLRDALPDRHADLELIRRWWSAGVTRPTLPGDHHAITNLVAPLVLTNISSENPQVEALRQLLRALQLLPRTSEQTGRMLTLNQPWVNFDEEPWAGLLERFHFTGEPALRLVLVDDMLGQKGYGQGWGEVLCLAVGATARPTVASSAVTGPILLGCREREALNLGVYGAESPEWLLDRLDGSDQRYRLRLVEDQASADPASPATPEILFLDLRLYPRREKEEAQFILQLIEKARGFQVDGDDPCVSQGRRLPWPGFGRDELDQAAGWARAMLENRQADGEQEAVAYLRALTFLPRLLALTDCALPIVLFSSTGRREIIEPLKPYGTIITDFEKPRFFGAVDEAVAEVTAGKFQSALQQALSMASVRYFLSGLASHPNVAIDVSPQKGDSRDRYTVEIYLDEKGEQNDEINPNDCLTVGGLLAVYPSSLSLEEFNQKLRDLINNSLDINKNSNVKLIKKAFRNKLEELTPNIIDEAKRCNVYIAAISVMGNRIDIKRNINQDSSFEDEHIADNLFRELFRFVIEGGIYTLSRHIIPKDAGLTINVFAATRVIPLSKYVTNQITEEEVSKKFFEDWGLKTTVLGNPPEKFLRHFNFDSARPLVDEILRHYRGSIFQPVLEKARAYVLNSYESFSHGRVLHILADTVLGKYKDPGVFELFWQNGFKTRRNQELVSLIKAQRFWMQGFNTMALHLARPFYENIDNLQSNDYLRKILWFNLKNVTEQLNGRELIQLTSLTEEKQVISENKEIEGQIIRRSLLNIIIESEDQRIYRATIPSKSSAFQTGSKVRFFAERSAVPGILIARKVKLIT